MDFYAKIGQGDQDSMTGFTGGLLSKWYDYINEPTLADAIMDRLTANAVRIELKGDSMRRKNQKK